MKTKILNGKQFIQWMQANFDDWFNRLDVEQKCQESEIYFDIGHFWDCIYQHRNAGTIQQRDSGIEASYSVTRPSGSDYTVTSKGPEFIFIDNNHNHRKT